MPILIPIEIRNLPAFVGILTGLEEVPIESTLITSKTTVQDIINLIPLPAGIMIRAVYDTNNNGIVDNSEQLNGQPASFYLDIGNLTGTFNATQITNLFTLLNLANYQLTSQKGQPNGYAPLNAFGVIDPQYIPLGLFDFVGDWDALTNTPALSDATGTAKETYIVSVAGTQNLGSGNLVCAVGDIIIHNGTQWLLIQTGSIGVTSWNGLSGVIVADTGDLPDSVGFRYVTDAQKDALNATPNTPSTGNPFATLADIQFNVLNYINSWNATTNIPVLADGIGTLGDAYIVSVAGTQNLGSGAITFAIGDLAIYNGTIWQQIIGGALGVSSVNGNTGAVTLDADDIPESATRFYLTALQNAAIDAANAPTGANPLATMADINFSVLNYINSWNAATNTPALADGVGSAGDAYIVGVAGTQNLGSGSQTFAVGDFAILSAALIWQKITGAGVGVSSWNGLTGAVLVTTNNLPDFTNKRYVTDSEKAGLDAAQAATFPASAINPYATRDWVNSIATSLTVTNEWLTPETFEDGLNVTGNGSARVLNTLTNPATLVAYTNASAGIRWPLVPSINVAVDTYDDMCEQQALWTMERGLGFSQRMTYHDNRQYCHNRGRFLPRTTNIVLYGNNPLQFIINGNGSNHRNTSGGAMIHYSRMPATQNDAVSIANNWIQYALQMDNMTIHGGTGDTGIRLGASYLPSFTNIKVLNTSYGIRAYFCLLGKVHNCDFGDCDTTGLYVATGFDQGVPVWVGGSLTNSASNGFSVTGTKFRVAPAAFSGLQVWGCDGVTVHGDENVFEGSNAGTNPTHHIYVNNQASTLVKRFNAESLHFEQLVTGSHIKIDSPGQITTANIENLSCIAASPTNLIETAGAGVIQVRATFCPDNSQGWKLRNVGAGNHFYFFDMFKITDQANLTAAANWDTTGGGTIPNSGLLNMLRQAY